MSRRIDRQEAIRIAAEKVRLEKEKEERENREFYERITSGAPWLFFRIVVVFCTLMALVTTIETFADGPTKKLDENEWKVDKTWEWTWHKMLDVQGYLFSPELGDWLGHVEGSMEMTYTPIFRTGKKLSYLIEDNEGRIRRHTQWRDRSIFSWFPVLQVFLLIPLITYIFKRQSPWFSFGRIVSLFFVLPGVFLVMFFAMS